MKEELRELYRYRELLYMLTYRDIKVRYKQSIMGFLWAVLMPVLIVMSGLVVRYAYALVSGKHLEAADIASVAVKSLPWAFLVSSIRFSCNSLIGNQNLVTKVYFPKEIFPVAAVLASLFDLIVASGALVILLIVIQTGWSANLVWVPLLLLMMVVSARASPASKRRICLGSRTASASVWQRFWADTSFSSTWSRPSRSPSDGA
jgi:lipopolysaccharide transport system permease protein